MSSVDAWYSTTVDMEEVLRHTRQGDVHIFVADVVKSFGTVDRDILDCALGRRGLPAWFRRVYLESLEAFLLTFLHIILNALHMMSRPSLPLPNVRVPTSRKWDRRLLQVSVCSSALPKLPVSG